MINKQSNRGLMLSAKKREEMFQAYLEHGNVNSVLRECKVHIETATKYRKVDKWDDRVTKIKRMAEEKANKLQSTRLVKNITLVRIAKRKVMRAMRKGFESKSQVADLNTLIRLEEFLSGSPDSRPDDNKLTIVYVGQADQITENERKYIESKEIEGDE